MRKRRVVAASASALLTSLLVVVAAAPASADGPTAHAAIGVSYPTSTTFKVCPNGTASSVGEWLFEVDGVRSDGSQFHIQQGGFTSSFLPGCSTVATNGTQVGTGIGTLWFARIGQPAASVDASGVPEFIAVAGVEFDWTPSQEANGFGT